jgi:hypothetical protein
MGSDQAYYDPERYAEVKLPAAKRPAAIHARLFH